MVVMDLIWACMAALGAGFVDAVVGGGGLVLTPALFALFPTAPPPALLGTNKATGIWGTAVAARQFASRVDMPWAILLPAALLAFCGSMGGAWTVTRFPPDALRRLLPFILLAVLMYTLARKDMGRDHVPNRSARAATALACGAGLFIGFYDGFFGPGTGSFLVFFFVRMLGFDFLHASASAKLLNTATNLAALLLLASKGLVWWHYAIPMAVANVAGSIAGTHTALKHGSGFVRGMFIVVVSLLILKTGYDAFLR
jgi:uncharacterized membrane protein YfcA